MPRQTVGYGIAVSRDPSADGWVRVSLRKHIWTVGLGNASRLVAETGFYSEGLSERDIVSGALRELLRAYEDDLS